MSDAWRRAQPAAGRGAGVLAMMGLVACAGLAMQGCASFQGAPEPIKADTVAADTCPTTAEVAALDATAPGASNPSKRQKRDADIGDCISKVDGAYHAFIIHLHEQTAGSSLALDLAALGLTSAGSVASGSAAKVLSAASSGVVGAAAVLNKDLYYQKTLTALIAQMDANRAAVYLRIRVAQQSDESVYTLRDAQHDLRDYEQAGTLDGAVAAITAAAQQSADVDQRAVHALFTASIVAPDVQARKKKLAQFVKSLDLASAAGKRTLDDIAAALGVRVPAGQDVGDEKQNVLVQIDRTVVDKASMDQISAKVASTAQQEF